MTGDAQSDVAAIRERIPTYRGYEDEGARHDSDMRVRAILGESLTDAHVRVGGTLGEADASAYDAVLARCMFGDQHFVKKVEHATLDAPAMGALVAADRKLVELEERINDAATAAELTALVAQVDAGLTHRSDILPDARTAR